MPMFDTSNPRQLFSNTKRHNYHTSTNFTMHGADKGHHRACTVNYSSPFTLDQSSLLSGIGQISQGISFYMHRFDIFSEENQWGPRLAYIDVRRADRRNELDEKSPARFIRNIYLCGGFAMQSSHQDASLTSH